MRVDLAKEKTYGAKALIHARKSGRGGAGQPDLPTIRPNQPEWDAWRTYFTSHIGFEPVAMQRVKAGLQHEMTVPADRPEQFDTSYGSALELAKQLIQRQAP